MTDLPGVPAALAQALSDKGYATLTPVQEAMCDPALAGRDVLVSAQTGSGKTVAFGLAMAAGLLDGKARFDAATVPLALIIAPTRELALQVQRELDWLFAPTGAVIASCVGGMDMRSERRVLDRGAHIVVGTPGRIKDHILRNSLDLSGLQVAVLDEADEMLDLGFREDLEFILQAAPATRRTLLFSATVSRGIAALAKDYQRDAVRVATEAEREQHVDIEYRAMVVDNADRENAIVNVLRYYEARNALVFCGTRATVNHLTARFNNRGFAVVALSGELSQAERTNALQAMRDGRARVCVATDVAARGIDLPGLELVVHADLPTNRETLLHRSGRTGRAGNKGVSALIVPHNARKKAERLFAAAGVSAGWGPAPSAEEVTRRDTERLLASPIFAAPTTAAETDLVALLLSAFTPEAITAGFVRQYMAARSAPEDLRAADSKAPVRLDAANSVWISVALGAAQGAEPRRLLPMLCRAGDLTRGDIGAIRVQDQETLVQLSAASAARFWQAIGPEGRIEGGIAVMRRDDLATPGAAALASVAQDPVPARPAPVISAPVNPAPVKHAPVNPAPPAADAQAAREPARQFRPQEPKPRREGASTGAAKPHVRSPDARRDDTRPAAPKPPRPPRKPGQLAARPAADVAPGAVTEYRARPQADGAGRAAAGKPRFKSKGPGMGFEGRKPGAGKPGGKPGAGKPGQRSGGKPGGPKPPRKG